ncbi:MAG: ribosome small subunit-dependent GTPase A [Gammaproteobacteria bacterium]|nr:ribosome small subunit-dependent GTPase A [Gammaproteobacteria bacterium]MCH9763430.1 ribosome small subunit-dependent GTPase A [Gammaproteobacteria bacterium]
MSDYTALTVLGWQSFFQQQLSLEEWDNGIPARIVELYKTEITVTTASESFNIGLLPAMPEMVVGDWVLLNNNKQFLRLLERKTCFSRKAAGHKHTKQLIAANIDTAFIVSSMNDDFSLNRIERFLALANESGAEPVVLLSKRDLAYAPETFVAAVQALDSNLIVEPINSLDTNNRTVLSSWLKQGNTIAMLGSSGVGKSTLINTLLGENRQRTADIRNSDQKGRHTTTQRSLITLNTGGLVLDTPGIREIQLTDCKNGIAATFFDVEQYARQCQFNDCQHDVEPGCAVQYAIESGDLDKRRLANYLKLLKEEVFNSATLAERRTHNKTLDKLYKRTQIQIKHLKGKE